MILYNPRAWFTLIFRFHKSDTFRILAPAIFIIAIFCGLLAFAETELDWFRYKGTSIIHTLLGFVISLLLVFRTDTAYDRWWEGRQLWGNLLNNSRNLSIKLQTLIPPTMGDTKQRIAELIILYGQALQEHLRQQKLQHSIPTNVHQPNFIATKLMYELHQLYKTNVITVQELWMIQQEATYLTDICGACERIKKTPIPFSYSLFIKKFIFVYVMTMPFVFVGEFHYWIILFVPFVFYVLASLELLAEEIEDPFGKEANDLPLESINLNIQDSVNEILQLNDGAK